jgi:hypothetical protein
MNNWDLHLAVGFIVAFVFKDWLLVVMAAIIKEMYDWFAIITPEEIIVKKSIDSIGDIGFTILGAVFGYWIIRKRDETSNSDA